MSGKKQQTFAKMTRERLVRERRERKQEKKRAAAAERKAQAAGNGEQSIDEEAIDAEPELESA
jgi:hypothetical protein